MKANSHTLAWLRIENRALRLEMPSFGIDLKQGHQPLSERTSHFHIATVETQLRDTGGYAGGRAFFNNFGRRAKWISGSSSPLIFHEFLPVGSCGILSLVGQAKG